jgi:hypothetical protein
VDSLLFSTRAWRQKGDDSLAAIINTRTDTVNLLSTKAWRQKGIDSVAALSRIGGSGTTNYVSKFTGTSTLGNSQFFDNGTNIGIGTITPGQKLDIVGNTITRGYAEVNNGTHFVRYQMPMASGTTGLNTFISNASGASLTGSGNDASYNVIVGHSAGTSLTTGAFNTAVGTPALQATTTGIGNTGIGSFAAYSVTTGIYNTGVGTGAIGAVNTGSNNTAVGRDALGTLTTGANNVAIGWRAGHFRLTSQSNSKTNNSIFIGYDTRSSADSVNNVIAIGTSVIDNGSNTTTIGNSSVVGTYIPAGESYFGTSTDNGDFRVQVSGNQYVSGNVGIGSTSPSAQLDVRGTGNIVLGSSTVGFAQISGALQVGTTNGGNFIVQTKVDGGVLGTALTIIGGASKTASFEGHVVTKGSTANDFNQSTSVATVTGNFGVGTTSMSSKAHIEKDTITLNVTNLANGTAPGLQITYPDKNIAGGEGIGIALGMRARGRSYIAALQPTTNRDHSSLLFYTTLSGTIGEVLRLTENKEMLIGYTADQGAYILQANGNGIFNGSLTTSAPNGGTAASWKLGIVVAGSYTAASNYLQVDVGGTLYYIGLVTPN